MINQMAFRKLSELIPVNNQMEFVSKISVSFPESSKILKRIADCDKTAINECIDIYGDLVWALTRKYTADETEAEIAVQEVFSDIWKYAARFDASKIDEATFISHVTCRNLIKRNNTKSDQIF